VLCLGQDGQMRMYAAGQGVSQLYMGYIIILLYLEAEAVSSPAPYPGGKHVVMMPTRISGAVGRSVWCLLFFSFNVLA
jgi:hypothetical protein